MIAKPLPIPEGMTKEEIDAMDVNTGQWRESEDFVCATCGRPAYYHPHTNRIWGCKICEFTTYSPVNYFLALDSGVAP